MAAERCVLNTPIGRMAIEALDQAIVRVDLRAASEELRDPESPLLHRAATQLQEYFAGQRKQFDLPMQRPTGASAFQQRVWDAMLAIPFGETRAYGELAAELGTSPRAVGGACGGNPLPILVPCHRVVAKNGLGGYSGDWETGMAVNVKKALLYLEQSDA